LIPWPGLFANLSNVLEFGKNVDRFLCYIDRNEKTGWKAGNLYLICNLLPAPLCYSLGYPGKFPVKKLAAAP
jgi:hypothetical protein